MWFCLTGHDPQKSTDTTAEQLVNNLPSAVTSSTKESITSACASNRNLRKIVIPSNVSLLEKSKDPVICGISDESIPTVRINQITITKRSLKRWICVFIGIGIFVAFFLIGMKWQESKAINHPESIIIKGGPCETQMQEADKSNQNLSLPDNFVLVPSGIIKNVEEWPDGDYDKRIMYNIDVDSFYIDKYELTQKEYERVMGILSEQNMTYEVWDPQKKFILKGDSLPVMTSLLEAFNYCNKRSQIEGYDGFYTITGDTVSINSNGNGYRLPHYIEWTYAARGGNANDSYTYAGGNKLKEVAWYAGNSKLKPQNVGRLKPNSIGLYDMSGNAGEFSGMNGDFSFWHTPMFSVEPYFGTNYPLQKKLSNDEKALRNGVRVILVPKGMKNSNLSIKSKYKQQTGFW